jgi:hypothetical protein
MTKAMSVQCRPTALSPPIRMRLTLCESRAFRPSTDPVLSPSRKRTATGYSSNVVQPTGWANMSDIEGGDYAQVERSDRPGQVDPAGYLVWRHDLMGLGRRIPVNVATRVTSGRQTSGRVGSAGDGRCSGAAVVPRSGS